MLEINFAGDENDENHLKFQVKTQSKHLPAVCRFRSNMAAVSVDSEAGKSGRKGANDSLDTLLQQQSKHFELLLTKAKELEVLINKGGSSYKSFMSCVLRICLIFSLLFLKNDKKLKIFRQGRLK